MVKFLRKNFWIYKVVPEYRKRFVESFVIKLLISGITVVSPYLFGWVIDTIFTKKDWNAFIYATLAYSLTFITNQFLLILLKRVEFSINNDCTNSLKVILLSKVLSMKASNLINSNTGDIILTINMASSVYTFANEFLSSILLPFVKLIIILYIMSSLSWEMMIIVSVFSITIVLLSDIFKKSFISVRKKYREEYGSYCSWIIDILNGMQDIKATCSEKYFLKKFEEKILELFKGKEKTRFLEIKAERVNSFLVVLFTCFFWGLSAIFVFINRLTIGGFLSVEKYFNQLVNEVNMIRGAKQHFHELRISIDKISDLLHSISEEYEDCEQLITNNLKDIQDASIVIENLNFQFIEDVEVLRNINMKVVSGEFVAIVGANGEGKSTLLDLLIGLFDLQSGTISFLGKDITEFPVNNLRIHIAYMQQETMLFGGTLFDNLRIYCPDATVAQMWDVLKICRMYDTVKGWKFGLFTDLSKGEILSSGQKQRIAIARILLRKPDVVLLDEPTSSLDSQTSEEIIDDFRRIFKNKILILVTHNVKCAEKADRIYVMEKGSIVAQGNHNELMKSCDIYKKLFQDQVSLLI